MPKVIVSDTSIKPILNNLQKTDFYLSKMVLKEALRLAGE